MCDGTPEAWKDIANHEGCYQVSSHGRIASLARLVRVVRTNGVVFYRRQPGLIVATKPPDLYGHIGVGLSPKDLSLPRKAVSYWVHQLVAEAFVGPRPAGMIVCHLDGNAGNNHASNLRWDTPSANRKDLQLHGTDFQANKVSCKWGHLLVAPNLTSHPHFVSRGWRQCYACARAHGKLKKHPDKWAVFQEVSDSIYRAVMGIDAGECSVAMMH